jgi:hypothetical protein
MNKDSYIIRRGGVFWFQKRLPKSITNTGSPHYRTSLKTSDIHEARRRRDLVLARYQQFVADAQGNPEDSYLIQVAKEIRTQVIQDKNGEDDHPLFYALSDVIEKYMQEHPSTPIEEARAASRIAAPGLGETLAGLVTEYLTEINTELTNQTVDEKRRHLGEYKKFIKYDYPIDELLSPDRAYDYLTGYILKLNQSHETRSKKLRNVSGFYEWCMQRGYLRSNPFAGLKVRTVRGRKGKKGGRRAWEMLS